MAKAQRKAKSDINVASTKVVFYMLLPLIFFAPLYRGLFFYEELVVAHMYTAIVAAAYFYLNRDHIKFSKNVMDYGAAGLVLAYTISCFVAVNNRDAVGDVMKALNYFLVYWLAANVARTFEDLKKLMSVIFASGFIVAFIGIGSAFGTFFYEGSFMNGLINSTLQYHNAAAIYMVAAGMVGLYLATEYKNIWARVLSSGVVYVMFLTAFGAGSRGTLVIAPIALLVQFLGLPGVTREKYFYAGLAMIIPFSITAKSILTFGVESEGYYWGMLLLGFLLACAIHFGFEKFVELQGKTKRYLLFIALSVLGFAIGAALVIKGADLIPATIAARLKSFSLKEANILDRFYFYKDALRVVADYPVFGIGGGGWTSIYKSYQSYSYYTTEVHSHPLQVLVETGITGFIFYLTLWLGVLFSGIKLLIKAPSNEMKALSWTAVSAAIALGLHSSIDFTFSLGAAMILAWTFFGVVRSVDQQTFGQTGKYFMDFKLDAQVRKFAGLALAVVFFAAAASFYIAQYKVDQAMDAYRNGNFNSAVSEMESAETFDSLTAKNHSDMAKMYLEEGLRSRDANLISKAVEAAQKAIENNNYDTEARNVLANAYLKSGRPDLAVKVSEEALSLAPFESQLYVELANIYVVAAAQSAQTGNKQIARVYVEQALNIPNRMKAKESTLDKERKLLFKGAHLDQISPALQQQLDYAKQVLAELG